METTTKPIVNLIGQDGNIFNLIGLASKALQKAGEKDKANEMSEKVFKCQSYNEALRTIGEYCEIH